MPCGSIIMHALMHEAEVVMHLAPPPRNCPIFARIFPDPAMRFARLHPIRGERERADA
jgi:hypothetical protein